MRHSESPNPNIEYGGYDDRQHKEQDKEEQKHNRTSWDDQPQRRRAHSSKTTKIHSVIVITLLVVTMLFNTGYAAVASVANRMNLVKANSTSNVSNIPIVSSSDMGEDEFDTSNIIMSDKDVEIFLLVGSDNAESGGGMRSDSMILVAIDRIHSKLKMTSIMRDLYAPIAGHKGSNKINFAYWYDSSVGNKDLTVTRATIEKCFGVTIDHFATVNMYMFVDFVEAVGWVDVEMTKAEAKYMDENGRWYNPEYKGCREAGTYSLSGWEALYYVRMRYVGDGDFDRTRRQRYFVSLVLERAKSMSYTQLIKCANAVLPHITTDLSTEEIFGYCFEATKLLSYDLVQLPLPIPGSYKMGWATIGSTNVSILITNFDFCAQVLREFIYDDDMTYVNGAEATGVVLPRITTKTTTTETEMSQTSAAPTPEETTATTVAATEPVATEPPAPES